VVLQAPASLIHDVEAAVSAKTTDECMTTLKRVADLFLLHADHVNDDHVAVFDDVLLCLIEAVEKEAKCELGRRLAPVDNAPAHTIQHLARHDDIAVAAPVLARSTQLSAADLLDIARTKGQDHLAAIAGRPALEATVTDAIVERGNRAVIGKLVTNVGATISERGFTRLAARAEGDEELTEAVGMRLDIPLRLLRQLMLKASERVQQNLTAFAPMETREEIHRVVSSITDDVVRQATIAKNFGQARDMVAYLRKTGRFEEASVLEFAKMRKHEEMIVGLSVLCEVSVGLIDSLLSGARHDGLLVACKSADLKWLTVGAVLTSRLGHDADTVSELRKAKAAYSKLTVTAAKKILKFCVLRENAVKQGA
jgi:uncharacterized protein (DUF2336 family)